jgi:S1-C subfamily serine protease
LQANTQFNQQNLTAGLQFGQATAQGLAITTVDQNNFLYTSGLRQGDVLVSYNGQPIRSQADFSRVVTYLPGQRVPVVVLRDGRQETIYVTYQGGVTATLPHLPAASGGAFLGVTLDPNAGAAVVKTVATGSPAEQARLQPGDMIRALNGNRVSSAQHVVQIVGSMQPGQTLNIDLSRQGINDHAQAVLATRPADSARTARALPVAPDAGAAVIERRTTEPRRGRVEDADNDGRLFDGDGAINRRGRVVGPREPD